MEIDYLLDHYYQLVHLVIQLLTISSLEKSDQISNSFQLLNTTEIIIITLNVVTYNALLQGLLI